MKLSVKKIEKRSHLKAALNIFLSVLIIVGVFVSVVSNLLKEPNELVQEVGIKTFRMFTVLSNMLMATAAALGIPFAVDGLRDRNYHMPRWIVAVLYSGTICVALTFFVALGLLSPTAGFHRIMVEGSNFPLHTLIPVCAMILFVFVNDFHRIPFRISLYAGLPVLIYATVYTISGVLIGEENGGWRDHYHFMEYMPWYVALILISTVTLLLATGLRLAHNAVHKRDKALVEHYYQNAERYRLPTIQEAIAEIAQERKAHDKGGELIVPRRLLLFLEKKYQSGKSMDALCTLYIQAYYQQAGEK